MGFRVLSREEAVTLKPSLPDPLQRELEHVLITGQGLKTLSDGTKIYTPPAWQRLRGGAISRDEADKILGTLITQASTLDTPSQDTLVTICTQMHTHIQTLILFTESASHQMQIKVKTEETVLTNLIDTRTKLYQREQASRKSLDEFQSELSGSESRLHNIQREINLLNDTIAGYDREIEKNKIPPIVGFVLASFMGNVPSPILTALFKKRIARQNELESARTELIRLRSSRDAIQAKINNEHQAITNFRKEISRLEKEKETKDLQVKNSGADLTALKNIRQALTDLLTPYEFLTDDIERIKQFAHNNSLTSRLTVNLVSDLLALQKRFTAIEYGS